MKLLLHDHRRCPFCIRVRLVLYLKDIEYEIVNEQLRKWTPWMLQNIKKPRVPVLQIIQESNKELVMPESNDINLWLDASFGKTQFTPEINSRRYQEMISWFTWCDEVLKPQVDLYKYGKNRLFDKELHLKYSEDLLVCLDKIELELQDKKYLQGTDMTLADIAIIPFIRQIMRTRNGEFNFSTFPNITKWSSKILDQDWFNDVIMKKRIKNE